MLYIWSITTIKWLYNKIGTESTGSSLVRADGGAGGEAAERRAHISRFPDNAGIGTWRDLLFLFKFNWCFSSLVYAKIHSTNN